MSEIERFEVPAGNDLAIDEVLAEGGLDAPLSPYQGAHLPSAEESLFDKGLAYGCSKPFPEDGLPTLFDGVIRKRP